MEIGADNAADTAIKRPFENEDLPEAGKAKIENQGRKRLACSNCRRRRKKCDLTYPCGNCQRLSLECNVNEEDLRKKRYAATYVKSLETHIAYLETSLKNLVDKVYPNDVQVLNNMMIGDVDSGFPNNLPPTIENPRLSVDKKRTFIKGSYYPEGPVSEKTQVLRRSTSALSVNSLVSSSSSTPSAYPETMKKERIKDLHTAVIVRPNRNPDPNLINNDPKVLRSLSKFYTWLYPGHYFFLHRESFLYGFFNHAENHYEDSNYCSTELIYAMCAVGSRLSPELHDMSQIYYEKSKIKLLQLVFDEDSVASITTVQALFCLAFYELGKGDNKIAWYLSGLAIRVGYEMGFQLDPQVWITTDSDDAKQKLTKSELEIRSRIYWGCYVADHLICVLLGRTSTLSVSNSTIPQSDELPELEGTEGFKYRSDHELQVSVPLKNLIVLSRVVQIYTAKIFIEAHLTSQKLVFLARFNLKVQSWRQSLPPFLAWSTQSLKDMMLATDPTISYFWYYYYIVRLIFNRPFLADSSDSRAVVMDALDDLTTLFTNFRARFQNFYKATLQMLYACLLATNCLEHLLHATAPDTPQHREVTSRLRFFSTILHKDMAVTFDLPSTLARSRDHQPLQLDQLDQACNSAYTHDFTLSNEIDELIRELFGSNDPQLPTT